MEHRLCLGINPETRLRNEIDAKWYKTWKRKLWNASRLYNCDNDLSCKVP